MKVSGYVNKNGSVSEVLSEDNQIFQETILPQAFTEALNQGQEICFYLEHDPNQILATTKNGSLSLNQDNVGLHMQATIVPTSDGNNAYTLIKSGIISNMSFGFFVLDDIWNYDTEVPLRTVTELDLLEVSAVKNPAYTSSEINARSKNSDKKVNIRGLSYINLSDKGGEDLDIKDISKEDLQAELDRRSKEDEKIEKKEQRSDNSALDVNKVLSLVDSCVQMCARSGMNKRSEEPVEPKAEEKAEEEPKPVEEPKSDDKVDVDNGDDKKIEETKENEPKDEGKPTDEEVSADIEKRMKEISDYVNSFED